MFLSTSSRLRLAWAMAAVTGLAAGLVPSSFAPAAAYVNPADPDVVAVAGGSYAAAPPASLDGPGHNVSDTVAKQLYIDASQTGKPVPTNAWWTDLAVSKHSGDLWADPLVNRNTVDGTSIYYPTRWNADGSARVLESPLTVGGTIRPALPPGDITLADFESGRIPAGWTATGDAFGAPSAGTAKGQGTVSGFLGNGLLNSFTNAAGDGARGTLTSPEFPVESKYVAFLIAGGNHPADEAVRLIIDGKTVESATGTNSEQLAWVTWDVSRHAGRTASIQLVDNLGAGWAHIMADQITLTDSIEGIDTRFNTTFSAASADALRWGDWNVSWRMKQAGGPQYMDATAARGTPYTWFEFSDMAPRLTLGEGAVVTGADGVPVTFPLTTDRLAVTQNGRTYGLHAAAESTFTRHGNVIEADLAADYLVISAVPVAGASLDLLHEYAFAVPRDTRMDYVHSAEAGTVTENWAIDTELLQGTNHDTIQGWLPHQWRETTNNLAYQAFTYDSPRGQVKTTVGSGGWTLSYRFTGLTPFAPAPEELGKDNDYDAAQMNSYVENYAKITNYGGDTYWGGKDLQQFATYMQMAKQIGNEDAYAALKKSLTTALTDWYTYTPGEKERFFARYDTWEALVGFGDSYGSFEFTDNHFHYGYFTLATALLAFEDPEWAEEFGPMATLVAKQYANWDRGDTSFPYLRTFDTWEGHSYAGGYSSPGGNNQESSSEAIQSWAGLYLLGTALGNADMQAAGAMGYVNERAAVQEYYLNQNGNPKATSNPNAVGATGPGVFPPAYKHTTTGILFDSGQAYATYFSADPAWIYGIQWMPTAPWFNYLGWDRPFSRSLLADMFEARPESMGSFVAADGGGQLGLAAKRWHGVGTDWGNPVVQNKAQAIESIQAAVTNAHLHNPELVTAKIPENPLYNTAGGGLYVGVDDGKLSFPAEWWTPATLPAALVPIAPPADAPDADVKTWGSPYPAYAYFAKGYTPDAATLKRLYSYDVEGFTTGDETELAQAASVYRRMGDAVGNVVLGLTAQSDPDFYAAVNKVLWNAKDPVATSDSMAGAVYYNAMSNRGLGTETLERHTSNPTSQVYFNAETGTYSYVVFNPTAAQQSYTVYDGPTPIGSIAVPARTQVTHRLDAALERIDITASTTATTVAPGGKVTYTATGIDQYGATLPLTGVTWKSSTGGTITADGVFTGTHPTEAVAITAASGGKTATATVRVGQQPVLTSLEVTPGFDRVVTGSTQQFAASGRDQYGDPIEAGSIRWSSEGDATVDATGLFTAGAVGAGHLTASAGGVRGSAVVAVIPVPADLAQGKPASSSSDWGPNTAAFAVDGNPGSRWESARTDDEWLQVDLGARYDLSRVTIEWENAGAARYEVQVSDNAAGPWTTVESVAKAAATPDDLAVEATGRYLRIAGGSRLTQYGYSIFGLQAYGTLNASAIRPTQVLVSPRQATVLTGRTTDLDAFAFDADANGGPTTAAWSVDAGGSIDAEGIFRAATPGGPFTTVAAVGPLRASAAVTVLDGAAPEAPGMPENPQPPAAARNVAVGKPVTASSAESAGLGGGLAVDGRLSSRWSSGFSDNEWIQVDLGSVLPLSSVELAWENAYGRAFTVQTRSSTEEPWRTIVTETAGTGGDAAYPVQAPGRYVRMLGTRRSGPYGYSLHEFRVFSSEGSPDLDLADGAPTAASSSENPAFGPGNATDGDASTRWASGWTDDEWVRVDLGASRKVTSATLLWENAHGTGYSIEGSAGAEGPWTTIVTETAGDGGKDVLPLSGSYRFLRMHGAQRATPYGYSLFSFSVR